MFRTLAPTPERLVDIAVEGRAIAAAEGANLAAVMLLSGLATCRTTPVSGAPRAPYCLMGVCFECLVEIDGIPNRQACMETVRAGMQVRCQRGAAEAASAGSRE